MRYIASNVSSASHDLHKEHTCLNRGQSHASKRFFVSPDALAPDGDETTVICRPAPITDDTRPQKLAFKPSGASSVSPRRGPFLAPGLRLTLLSHRRSEERRVQTSKPNRGKRGNNIRIQDRKSSGHFWTNRESAVRSIAISTTLRDT